MHSGAVDRDENFRETAAGSVKDQLLSRKKLNTITSDNNPGSHNKKVSKHGLLLQPMFIVAVILLGATLAISHTVDFREKIPAKKNLDQFPLKVGEWSADRRQPMAQKFIDVLDLSEYVIINYHNRDGKKVNFYVAYYESQRKGESIHSPATCLPGSGWSFDQSGTVKITNVPGNNGTYGGKPGRNAVGPKQTDHLLLVSGSGTDTQQRVSVKNIQFLGCPHPTANRRCPGAVDYVGVRR